MKQFLTFIFFLISFRSFSQVQITGAEAPRHIGDSVKLCEKVYGTRFMERTSITILNLGKEFPNQLLIVVIKGADRNKFPFKPEVAYMGKRVCVTGRISEFGGKPQLIVTDPGQIKIE